MYVIYASEHDPQYPENPQDILVGHRAFDSKPDPQGCARILRLSRSVFFVSKPDPQDPEDPQYVPGSPSYPAQSLCFCLETLDKSRTKVSDERV